MPEIFKGKLKFKFEYLIVVVLIAVVAIIALTTFNGGETKTAQTETEIYLDGLEKKLKSSIEEINGVKSASVSISLDGGIKTVVAENVKTVEQNGIITTSSSPVIISGEPIVLGKIYPQISGVVIVCNCGNNLLVKMNVLDVVTTMLGVSCEKVRILTQ